MALSGYRTLQYIKYVVKDRVQGQDPRIRKERMMMWAYWAVIFAVVAWFGVVAEWVFVSGWCRCLPPP
ncbi:hypothetical protein [Pseudomonas sp. SST3]|uniref:hypothetical protein n=1 Tax=Pseudomonas sp. SST3 TaxID=2267882 RepID=UPI001F511082|nr:hypothetical protein [Pseudomonas sp. SST3]